MQVDDRGAGDLQDVFPQNLTVRHHQQEDRSQRGKFRSDVADDFLLEHRNAGGQGGQVVAAGTQASVARNRASRTSAFLAQALRE